MLMQLDHVEAVLHRPVLPFNQYSSPALFNKYANAFMYAMQGSQIPDLLHFLDDYFVTSLTGFQQCQENISAVVYMCTALGFTVNPKKITAQFVVTNFLGIDIDSIC